MINIIYNAQTMETTYEVLPDIEMQEEVIIEQPTTLEELAEVVSDMAEQLNEKGIL